MTITALDLPPGPEPLAWVDRRAGAAARTWTVSQRTHPGDVAWGAAQPSATTYRRVWIGPDDDVVAWVIVERLDETSAYADVHLDPRGAHTSCDLAHEVLELVRAQAPTTFVALLDREQRLWDACLDLGGQEQAGPWFTHLLTTFSGASAGRRPLLPAGYRIRPVRPQESAERVQVHRRAWSPSRVKQLAGLEPDGQEGESTFDLEAYERVRGTALYRPELDLVVEAPDGSLAASALGWYDSVSRSGLIEPVGTAPEHAVRGLARAACVELLTAMLALGAGTALVCPRGDDGYPVPARLYRSLGMSPVARTRTVRLDTEQGHRAGRVSGRS